MRNRLYRALRWSEKYTRTDMVYLTKGGFWLVLLQVISAFTGFALVIAFANLLPPVTYGIYQFILATAGILSITTLSGLNVATLRSVARGAEGTVMPAFKTKMGWGLLGSLVSIILAVYYFIQGNIAFALSFLIVAIFLPPFYALGISGALLSGKQLFKANAYYNIVGQIVAASTIFLALHFSDNIVLILLTYFASWTIIRAITFKITIKNHKENDVDDPDAKNYGKHLSVMGAIGNIGDYADKLLIFHYVGAIEVAIYSLAIAPVMQMKGLLKHLNTLAFPKLSRRSADEIQKEITNKSLKTLLASLPFIALYIIAAPYIYKVFFPAYLESVIYSQVFATVLIFTALGTMPTVALESQLEIKKKYILTAFSKILKPLLMIALIIPYGIWGIVIAVIITNMITSLLSLWLVKN